MTYQTTAQRSQSVYCGKEPSHAKDLLRANARFLLRSLGKAVSFVQVGANDGERGDLLSPLIREQQWRGVLVEPVPQAMERLRKTYEGCDGLLFQQVAIWPDSSPPQFWVVEGDDQLSSFSHDTIMLHAGKYDDLEQRTSAIPVQFMRLDELCRECAIEPDVIAVDAEGCDDIVLSSYDLSKSPPAAIFFEHVMLSKDRSLAMRERLDALGYVQMADRHDCLAVLPDRFSSELVTHFSEIQRLMRNGS